MDENLRVKSSGFRGQFLETIQILDGIPQNLQWHQRRVDATLLHFYPAHKHSWQLIKCIETPEEYQKGMVRCRIVYDAHFFSIHFFRYVARSVKSLQLVEIPMEMDYRYKYADRKIIEDLYGMRGDADDVLMTRDGWITDTSIANIAFEKTGRWYTSSIPLLAGTTWKRLVTTGVLIPQPIHKNHLHLFESFRVFNAMNDWYKGERIPVEKIFA